MPLELITITGADDNTNIDEMLELSAAYPKIEWGILVSSGHGGDPRWPSHSWQEKLLSKAPASMNLSMHICGRWVRELLVGNWSLNSFNAPISTRATRAQINTHAQPHVSTLDLYDLLNVYPYRWIFQLDGVNDHLLSAAENIGLDSTGLFDCSHGAGISPVEWPVAPLWALRYNRGYAGGLGPNSLAYELPRIKKAAGTRPFWIDMERNVRTEDDSRLDMAKVRRVLQVAG